MILSQNSGGLPHYTAELANALAKETRVTVMKPPETTAEDIFSDQVSIINCFKTTKLSYAEFTKGNFAPIKNMSGVLSYWRLKRVEDVDPDIVHITSNLFPQVQLFYWVHNIDDKYPTAITYHDVDKLDDLKQGTHKAEIATELFNRFAPKPQFEKKIVHSEENKEVLMEKGDSQSTIQVIPHGSFESFNEYDHSNVSEEKNTVLFFGNIVPAKGLDVAVKAVESLTEEITDIKLIIAGDGRISNDTMKIIEEHPENYEVNNEFIPNKKVGEYYTRSQVALIPHRKQGGHSGTLTIAYSFNVPVVASNVGDFPELVDERGCGITVPANDPIAMADAIRNVLRDDEMREGMAKKTNNVTDDLSWANVAKKHIQVYESICN
ncbi:lipopolysaccharide transferase family protein [Haloferax sulfurifontis ATCC BAA-897]|uniref:Lipopolysaccharide transferase family protein n=1 Tax=Haloferax sulfurifontis ATCC BAA-897 TaxID=662480 RepID=M0HX54_9EURY|nr:lipopolysaccharide transferase family protein [Haloferax sulfurifontis ATCC BAA-897]